MNFSVTKYLVLFFCLSLLSVSAETGVRYYSNSIGSRFSVIPEYETPGEDEWWIEIFHSGASISRKILYKGESGKKRWLYSNDKNEREEQYFQDGILRRITRSTEDGIMTAEVYYDNKGKFIEEKRYLYDEGIVRAIESYDKDGNLLNTDNISIRKDGSLRNIERVDEEEERTWGWERGSNEILSTEWKKEGEIFVLNEYDGAGRIQKHSEFDNDKLIVEKDYFYFGDSLERSEENDYINDILIVESFGNGLSIRKETIKEGLLSEKISNKYDSENRLTETKKDSPYITELWQYEYEEDIHRESYFKNGIKVSEKDYMNGIVSEERLFRDNKLFSILYYNKGLLEKEEYWQNGRIIRSVSHKGENPK